MKCLAQRIWLYRSAPVSCCILIAVLLLMPATLRATQPPELRLFHEPTQKTMDDEPTPDVSQSQTKLNKPRLAKTQKDDQLPVYKPPVANPPSTNMTDTQENSVYRYTGFITSTAGQHYLINGRPLADIHTLVLVSVKLEGRSLVLKTSKGRSFELSVGQSIVQESL